jgi:hypothetical protein
VIIQQAVWLYARFTLSFRDVEDLSAERGIMVSYEPVRRWVKHFKPATQCASLPQQTLMCQLYDIGLGPLVSYGKASLDQPIHHATRMFWEFVEFRHPTDRQARGNIDASKPGNERCA